MINQGSRLQFYGKMCRRCYGYSQDILRLQEERMRSKVDSGFTDLPPTSTEIEIGRSRDALNLGLVRLLEEALQYFEQKGIKPNEIPTLLECCANCDYTAPSISKYVTQILPSDS